MSARSRKSRPTTSDASRNATSSPASASGLTHCEGPDGQMRIPCGQGHARVSHSVQPDGSAASTISVISGPHGSGSSESVSLTSSLASRLRAALGSRGSTLFRLTWKERHTPSGRSIPALRASARRTSDSDSTSWPSPVSEDAESGARHGYMQAGNQGTTLLDAARLASWPSPTAENFEGDPMLLEARRARMAEAQGNNGFGLTLGNAAQLAAWATPKTTDADRSPSEKHREKQKAKGHGTAELTYDASLASWPTPLDDDANNCAGPARMRHLEQGRSPGLNVVASLATWPTPTREDSEATGVRPQTEKRTESHTLPSAARLADSGETPRGSPAATGKRGQLSPGHSRWLMGLPPEWCDCAVTAMQSLPRKRRRSSKRTSPSMGDAA